MQKTEENHDRMMKMTYSFSIIIPTLNEAEGTGDLLRYLHQDTRQKL